MLDPVASNRSVTMELPAIGDVPRAALPDGYAIHHFAPGDERAWTAIQAAADRYNEITPELFHRAFGRDAAQHHARILFARDAAGDAVGTSAAWWGHGPAESWGRVHWVAVLPAHQERGIGRALVTETLRLLRALGHTRAYLTTSSARLPAIRLYDSLGFRPRIESGEDRETWRAIARAATATGTPLTHAVT